jgi:hypothetical protein
MYWISNPNGDVVDVNITSIVIFLKFFFTITKTTIIWKLLYTTYYR